MVIKKYKFGFDFWGLLLFLIIMIPNFIWFAVPAPNDVLRADSITVILDTIASIFQVLMAAALCIIVNRDNKKIKLTPLIIVVCACCLLYYASWALYYNSITNAAVILGLTLMPCLAFLFFAIDRKNFIAVIPTLIFTICHMIHSAVNFII